MIEAARARIEPFLVSYLNAANVNRAYASSDFFELMNRMDCLYADGQAVVWAAHWRGHPVPERINAGDFTRSFIDEATREGLRIALVGGRPGEAEAAVERFRSWSPEVNIVLTHDGFFDPEKADAVAAAIEQADPDLVLMGMGSPRQEQWALEWSARGRPRVWWCVGALFEYYAGSRKRAPVWMRRAGLEWVVRLVLEPGRLWKRYLIGNPLFVWRVLRGRPPGKLNQPQMNTDEHR